MKRVCFRPLTLLLACSLALLISRAEAVTFRLSSIGYHPQGAKVAVIEDIPQDQDVRVVLFDPGRRNPRLPLLIGAVVHEVGKVKVFTNPRQAGPPTKSLLVDFSDFKQPGTYELRLDGTEIKSQPIRITDFLYWDTLKPVVKSFYFQRCGQDVEDRHLGMYHAACHLKDAAFLNPEKQATVYDTVYGEEGRDVIGGWHNGGDYAKYATSASLSAAKLLAMAEWNPKPFKFFRLDYPLFEPGYGSTNDILHEIKAGLDWLLAMQRRDGAVYRKVAGHQWPGNVSPEYDEQKRYLYGISTHDTANFAAVFAMASRGFKEADLGYSIRSLLVAEKAWDYLQANPKPFAERSATDYAGSGEFLDPNAPGDMPNRLWAAAELYVATGKPVYHQYFLNHLPEVPIEVFSWQNPALLGITDYLLYADRKDEKTAAALEKKVLTLANSVMDEVRAGAWPSGLRQYGKASNREIAERAALLVTAFRLSGKPEYREAASRSLAYLFGVNPLGMTYVTGLDGQSVKHPVHRWMIATDKTLSGYLVDGPNEFANDGKIPPKAGALSYIDAATATSVNESTLLNNAGLAHVLGILNDSYNVNKGEEKESSPLDFQLAPERPGSRKK